MTSRCHQRGSWLRIEIANTFNPCGASGYPMKREKLIIIFSNELSFFRRTTEIIFEYTSDRSCSFFRPTKFSKKISNTDWRNCLHVLNGREEKGRVIAISWLAFYHENPSRSHAFAKIYNRGREQLRRLDEQCLPNYRAAITNCRLN